MGLFGSIMGSVLSSLGNNATWYCDGCHAVLNEQEGFNTLSGRWTCTECGEDNDVSESNLFESEEAYRAAKGIPNCPYCGGVVTGDAPDAEYWFNCDGCGERFFLEDGELISPFARRGSSGRTCDNCGQSMDGAEYTAPWENGNNKDGFLKCPHCGSVTFLYQD